MTLGREKLNFLNTPTPIQRLDNISADLGINLYLKRDDLTNFGTGGNKLRKLEYLAKDAIDNGYTMPVMPPYSSITTANQVPSACIFRKSTLAFMVSGT